MKCVLVLEDGTYFLGEAFGSAGETAGEIIYNTSMTGYQEITTDPNYSGQIVVMTYPLIGNYGFNNYDNESSKTHVHGFIVKELCDTPSNWRSSISPDEFFSRNGITGIKGIDTRALTQHIRQYGSMYGVISTQRGDVNTLLDRIYDIKSENLNPVTLVTTTNIIHRPGPGKRVVVLDLGVKNSIIEALEKRNCDIVILPAFTSWEEILSLDPDGILLSNGPGNPADLPEIKHTIENLIGRKPILGLCLGYQLLGLALGGVSYKLKVGHHGSNHPVRELATGRCYITVQNHSYALKNCFSEDIIITHTNINDDTLEGFKHRYFPILGMQYNPEASIQPGDSPNIFDDFIRLMEDQKILS